jgi:hypothetical protein
METDRFNTAAFCDFSTPRKSDRLAANRKILGKRKYMCANLV